MAEQVRFGYWLVICWFSVIGTADAGNFEIFPRLTFLDKTSSDASECVNYLSLFENGLQQHKDWAVRMWDSSVKQPVGWVAGNTAQFGNFDECMATKAPMPLQFCLSQLRLSLPIINDADPSSVWHDIQNPPEDQINNARHEVYVGVCVPASCQVAVQDDSQAVGNWSIVSNLCTMQSEQNLPLEPPAIALISFSAFMIVLAFVFTFIDQYSTSASSGMEHWIKIFSLKKHLKSLGAASSNPNDPLAVAHGLKVLGILLIITEHRFAVRYTLSAFNHEYFESNARYSVFLYVAQFDTAVDTFFFLSGLLLAYPSKTVNAITYILVRIFRLTPLIVYLGLFNAYVMQHLGSGPLWNAMQGYESFRCAKNWWLNALFVQNYVRDTEMCNIHTWYVSADFHCFLVMVALLCLLSKHKRVGLAVTILLAAVAVIVPGVIAYTQNLDSVFRFYLPVFLKDPSNFKPFKDMYVKSHNRAAVYFVGFLAGLYFKATKDKMRKPNKMYSAIYLVASLLILLTPAIYGLKFDPFAQVDFEAAMFSATRRPLWGLGLFFFLLANRTHKIPVLTHLLSCRVMVVLGRLTYGVFIMHFLFIMGDFATLRTAPLFTYYDVMNSQNVVFTFLVSTLTYIFLEQPLRLLMISICFPSSMRKNGQNSENAESAPVEKFTLTRISTISEFSTNPPPTRA